MGCPRLEGPGPQEFDPICQQEFGRLLDHRLVFDGTGPGNHRESSRPDASSARHRRVGRVHFPAGQLEGLVTRMHSLTPSSTSRKAASTAPVFPVMPMAVRVARQCVRCQIHRADRVEHLGYLVLGGSRLHDNEHNRVPKKRAYQLDSLVYVINAIVANRQLAEVTICSPEYAMIQDFPIVQHVER